MLLCALSPFSISSSLSVFSYCPSPLLLYSCMLSFSNQEKGGLSDTLLFAKLRKYQDSVSQHLLPIPNKTNKIRTTNSLLSALQMLKLRLWGEEGHLHIFKHYKTVFIGMSFSLLAITRAVHTWQLKLGFWPVSKTLSGRSKMSQMLCTK